MSSELVAIQMHVTQYDNIEMIDMHLARGADSFTLNIYIYGMEHVVGQRSDGKHDRVSQCVTEYCFTGWIPESENY